MDNVEEDCDQCDALHLSLFDATRLAQDRPTRRRFIRNHEIGAAAVR